MEVGSILSAADRKLGALRGLCYRLKHPHLISGACVHREAVLSSRIEGTQSTESDLYLFDIDPDASENRQDLLEVRNYVTALNFAIERRGTLPFSLRFMRELHARLMSGVRGKNKTPGEFRASQNWIGGSMPSNAFYVPPPVEEMKACLDALEKFFHRANPGAIPPLIECAMAHYQFEAIHPFLDGNGRVGRLLITYLTIERDCLDDPLLYLSAYFEKHREEYYDRLAEVSHTGEWRNWLIYFLKGVAEQADEAVARAQRILDLMEAYLQLDVSPTAQRLVERLFVNPYTTIKSTSETLEVSVPTAASAVRQLESAEVLTPMDPSRQRGQLFVAREILRAYTTSPTD